jgi:hypothetical protein
MFLRMMIVVVMTLPQIIMANLNMTEIKENKFFNITLEFDKGSHLYKLPVYLGYHNESLKTAYWCSLDLSMPTVIVPNKMCQECSTSNLNPKDTTINKNLYKYTTPQKVKEKSLTYPHKMMYWKYTDGSFTVRPEENVLILDYDPSKHLSEQMLFRSFEFYSIMKDQDE